MPYKDKIADLILHKHAYFWATIKYKYHGVGEDIIPGATFTEEM